VAGDAVQLLSVHQAKGLEFPVVVVADLGHRFNLRAGSSHVVLDEEYGLCSRVQPPGTRRRYPSLNHWLADQRSRREALGEEVRLFYVACTRARDWLILSGAATSEEVAGGWGVEALAPEGATVDQLLSARCWLDWLGPWLAGRTGVADFTVPGRHALCSWTAREQDDVVLPAPEAGAAVGVPAEPTAEPDPAALAALRARLAWSYPHEAASVEPGKASVSQLRRRVRDETNDEAQAWFRAGAPSGGPATQTDARAVGSAHHRVLEHVPLDLPVTRQSILNTVTRLRESGTLSEEEARALDLDALTAFWASDLGRTLQERRVVVHRELPFTARLGSADLRRLGLAQASRLDPSDFVVVQGIADLVLIGPDEIWLVDYKTDRVDARALMAKVEEYRPQMALYALALSRILDRPVTRAWLHFLALRQSVDVPL
jgi:ATP-dependent helicase/nuclease subunit A